MGRSLLYSVAIHGSGIRRISGGASFREGSLGPGRSVCRHDTRAPWAMGGAPGGIRHRNHIDVGHPLFLESSPVGRLHRSRRRPAGGYLYHARSAILRDEHESSPHLRLGSTANDLEWTVGLPDCAPAGHAVRRRTLSVAEGPRVSEVLQAPPRQQQALHILRSQWRIRIMTNNRYDVIIIGTGAGGGTLAYHLAPSGKRILILERGDYVPREKANWDPQVVNLDAHYNTKESWLDKDGKDLHPHTNYFVGGNTKFYGAALFRLRKEDFGELRHHGGISPAWPITYDDLEPYYARAEDLYHVHGERGADPTEPPASGPYPYPAVSHEPRIQQLADDLEAAGYRPFHAPCGIRLEEQNMPYSACVRCQNCDGFPCAVHGKSDAEVLGVRPALEHPNVTLLTNAKAVRLETNDAGTAVTGVIVEREGETEQFAGEIVVLACGAANTAALLLSSANDKHPNGLANGSDQVGRNYMFHASEAVLALSREENPTVFQKTLGLNDFYFGTDEHDYPLGNIQMVGKSQAPMFRGEKPTETKLAPGWTLEKVAKHAIDFLLSTEDQPLHENRVTVDGEGRLTLAYTASNDVPK